MDSLADDTIITLASFLQSYDLVNLALTCRRFGSASMVHHERVETPPSLAGEDAMDHNYSDSDLSIDGSDAQCERSCWSLVEEAARRRVTSAKAGEWTMSSILIRCNSPDPSWMAVCYRLEQMQMHTSLVFHRLVGNGISYVNINKPNHVQIHERALSSGRYPLGSSCAISQHVMKSGRHHAQFTVTKEGYIEVGIIRPIGSWDTSNVKTMHPRNNVGFKDYCNKKRANGIEAYEGNIDCYLHRTPEDSLGRSNFLRANDVIGLLLEFGGPGLGATLNVYKNGRRLGAEVGLLGYFRWVVLLTNAVYQGAVKIESAPLPPETVED